MRRLRIGFLILLLAVAALPLAGCARREMQHLSMEATAYCPCGKCCEWHRGSWRYLKLNFWNRYTNRSRIPYSGRTASGAKPRTPQPGLVSLDSVSRPWMIPVRVVFFPWLALPRKGTIAADTNYYPFGTEMYVPGYGWGVVRDRGGAIKGPERIDLFYRTHGQALQWGRQRVTVEVRRPEPAPQ